MSHPLTSELDWLQHRDRVRRMVALGRAAAQGDGKSQAVIASLAASTDAYERLLALSTVYGSRDGAQVLPSISDPSRSVRNIACGMLPVFCSDLQVGSGLAQMVERRLLRRTLCALVRRRRRDCVDAFLAQATADLGNHQPESGLGKQLWPLISLGSPALVAKLLAESPQIADRLHWDGMASWNPRFTAEWFLGELRRRGGLDANLRYRLLPLLATLAQGAPEETLNLVTELSGKGFAEPGELSAALRRLIIRYPREVFDLLRDLHESGRPARPPGAFGVVRFDRVAPRLGATRLRYLVNHAWGALGDQKAGVTWFLRLGREDQGAVLAAFGTGSHGAWGAFLFRYLKREADNSLREEAFETWSCAAQHAEGSIPPEVLDYLPQDLREREARRHLTDCPSLASKPERRLAYARLLPFEEAQRVLAPFLGHPEGEERGRAQKILISSLQHDRSATALALANAQARKFEQDPVRLAMLEAFAALPVARFRPEHLESVGVVVKDALEAADLSSATAAQLERWITRLFRLDGAWGAQWISRLLEVRGSISTWELGTGLTGVEAAQLAPAIESLARTWATRERANALIGLAVSLGVRLRQVPPLLSALETLARDLPFVGVAARSLGILHERDRPRFARLVPELLAVDKSYILLPIVARFVSLKRQDLLGRFLAPEPMSGRFATGRTHWVIDFETGFGRWSAGHQRAYAKGLAALLGEHDRDTPTLRFAVHRLARLAFADPNTLIPFASDQRQAVREMAIRALPWLDAAQGLPVLIDALGDGRARWAIYALRKSFSELSASRVLAELRAVPTAKVTVAKEVIRLLGEMGNSEAYAELLALEKKELHRDVRIALLRALWDHLDQEPTWEIFARAVQHPDWVLASKLADIPLGRLSDAEEARLLPILAALLGRPEPEARLNLLSKCAYLPLRDAEGVLLRKLLEHMGVSDPEEAARAFAAVLPRMAPDEVGMVAGRLTALFPRRRHLEALLSVLSSQLGSYAPKKNVQLAGALLPALLSDPATIPQWLALGARLWGWRELGQGLALLSARDLLHYDVLQSALSAVKACVHPAQLEAQLFPHADPRIRRIALAALVAAASPKSGWTSERRARLRAYQQDSSVSVSGPANFVFPPEKTKAANGD